MYYGMNPLQYSLSLLGINTISNIIISIFYIMVLTPKKSKLLSAGVLFVLNTFIAIIFIPFRTMITMKTIIFTVVLLILIVPRILFTNRLIEKISAIILNYLAQLFCEIAASIIILSLNLLPTSQEAATNFKISLFIATPLLIIFSGIAILIWKKIFKSNHSTSTDVSIIMFSAAQLLIPCIFGILIFEYEIINISLLIAEIFICIFSLLSFIIMIYNINSMAQYEKNINLYKKYIEFFYEREQTFQAQYREIRNIKHDLNKHIHTLEYLKDDHTELRNYILNLDDYISQKTNESDLKRNLQNH